MAFGLENIQLVNAPDWIATERFAIEARTSDATPTDTIRLMLRTMLQDELGLRLESRRGPLDVLVVDKIERPTEN